MNRTTVLSTDRKYRYTLWRKWERNGPRLKGYVLFIMLNPSTADETKDDPTIKRCKAFAERWGYEEMCVVNLFALRATDPAEVYLHPSPVGEMNNAFILEAARSASLVVCAWGNHGTYQNRDLAVIKMLLNHGRIFALRETKTNCPAHPLYLPKYLDPQPFCGRGVNGGNWNTHKDRVT